MIIFLDYQLLKVLWRLFPLKKNVRFLLKIPLLVIQSRDFVGQWVVLYNHQGWVMNSIIADIRLNICSGVRSGDNVNGL